MTRPIPAQRVEDLEGGEIVRVDSVGLVRITHRMLCGERWAIALDADLRETRIKLWLAPQTRVVEVVQAAHAKATSVPRGVETDPLMG